MLIVTHLHSLRLPAAINYILVLLFYATLLSSITLYRISTFHQLARYTGPFLAIDSKFWNVLVMVTGVTHG